MKPHLHILHPLLTTLLAALVLAFAPLAAHAQRDTLPDRQLFPNAASDDANIDAANHAANRNAADTIAERLRTLQSLYSAGKYSDALQLSQSIHDNRHLTKSQNLLRLKYTVAAYKDLAYHREADSAARLFWQKDPFYDPDNDPDAPVPFCEIMSNYYTKPKFSIWVAAGITTVMPRLDTVRTIIDPVECDPKYDIQGYSAQIGFAYRQFKIISVSLAPTYTSYTMERVMQRVNIATFHYNEKCQILALPLFVEAGLYFGRETFVPSIYAGAQLKYLISSRYNAYTQSIGHYTEIPSYRTDLDAKTRLNYSVLGGIRLNLNRRRITYFADLGVSMDLLPHNDPSQKYNNYDLLYQNLYVPDVYRMFEYKVMLGIKVNMQYKTIAKYNYGHL